MHDKINKTGLIIVGVISLLLIAAIGSAQTDAHLKMLEEAKENTMLSCDTEDDLSFSLCPFLPQDTITYMHTGIPPVHHYQEVVNKIDSAIERTFLEEVGSVAIRVQNNARIRINYEYLDGKRGKLAKAEYPKCVHSPQNLTYDLFDFPPGESTPEDIKILYGDIKDIVMITEHELGHILGDRHSYAPHLMAPEYHEGRTWSKQERVTHELKFKREFFPVRKNSKTKITKNFKEGEFHSKSKRVDGHYLFSQIPIVVQITRDRYATPIKITSTLRDWVSNDKAGGSKTSTHLTGRAVDFKFESRDAHERFIFEIVNKTNLYHSLVAYKVKGIGLYDSHIHLDFREREEVLIWDKRNALIEEGSCPH